MRRTTAVRFADLLYDDRIEERVRRICNARRNTLLAAFGSDGGLDEERVIADLHKARQRLGQNVCDTTTLLHQAISDGKRLLFEGANGVLLDVDHGTYPFVTSSSTGFHGIGPGAGVSPGVVSRVIGVCKAYATRVGSGPFVTELNDEVGDRIRVRGHEFGTTTGRPRRCGWFDAVACRYAAQLSGVTHVALLHLDTLTGFERVGVCTGYQLDGRLLQAPPSHVRQLERIQPVYEWLDGWSQEVRHVTGYDDLPPGARAYVERIETLLGLRVALIGVGPERAQTLVREPLCERIAAAPPAAR